MAVPGGAQRNGRNGNALRRNATRHNRTAAPAWLRPSSGRHKWRPYGGGARRGRRGGETRRRCPGGAQRNRRNGNALRRNVTRRNRTAAPAWQRPSSGRHKWRPYGGGARRGQHGGETAAMKLRRRNVGAPLVTPGAPPGHNVTAATEPQSAATQSAATQPAATEPPPPAWLRPSSGRHKWRPYGGGAGGAQRNRLNRTALRRNATRRNH